MMEMMIDGAQHGHFNHKTGKRKLRRGRPRGEGCQSPSVHSSGREVGIRLTSKLAGIIGETDLCLSLRLCSGEP